MLLLQLTFHRRLKDALKLNQIKIELERFEIRIQFRNRWVFWTLFAYLFWLDTELQLLNISKPQQISGFYIVFVSINLMFSAVSTTNQFEPNE